MSRTTLDYLAGVVRRHRRKIGSCWRNLNCRRQALLVMAHLHTGETFAALAAGFGIGTSTAWRHMTPDSGPAGSPDDSLEVVDVARDSAVGRDRIQSAPNL